MVPSPETIRNTAVDSRNNAEIQEGKLQDLFRFSPWCLELVSDFRFGIRILWLQAAPLIATETSEARAVVGGAVRRAKLARREEIG